MVIAAMKLRRLLRGRKVMTNLDNILKSRDITLSTKVHLIKAMVFPVVMYECESWTIKKAECRRIDAFELQCWRRLSRVPSRDPSWACQLFQRLAVGQDGLGEARLSCQSSCTERLRLRHVPRPCQPAPTPGQQPQPSKGHLEQKARPGKQHVRSHSGPSLTLWACAHSSLPQLSSPQTDQVHHPTSLPAPLPQPSLYTKTKQNVFHHCLPANSFLKKTFWRKPQMPQARPVILSPQEQAWA